MPASTPVSTGAPVPGWSLEEPIYTTEQAERGAGIFLEVCSACHLREGFTSFDFRVRWVGTVGELYRFVSTSMPQDEPGRLDPEAYADVLAFIFRENHLPAGEAELGTDVTALNRYRLESPAGP